MKLLGSSPQYGTAVPSCRRCHRASSLRVAAASLPSDGSNNTTVPEPTVVSLKSPFHTGGAHITTSGATASLTGAPLLTEKTVYVCTWYHVVHLHHIETKWVPHIHQVLRHGLTTWNAEGRIQGSSNESTLTPAGRKQAARCRDALRWYVCGAQQLLATNMQPQPTPTQYSF